MRDGALLSSLSCSTGVMRGFLENQAMIAGT